MKRPALALLALVLLVPLGLVFADAAGTARAIKQALDEGNLGRAMSSWEMEEDAILDSTEASFVVGEAFSSFGAKPATLRYRDIPDTCAEIAVACAEALEEELDEVDLKERLRLSRLELSIAYLLRKCGKGAEADKQEDAAKKNLVEITEDEEAPIEAFIALGQVYVALVEREPPKAEEHLQKATELYAKARETGGDTASLCLSEGRLKVRLAELKCDALAKTKKKKDRGLEKIIKESYEEALDCFQRGLKLNEKSKDLKTAYNECLWLCMRCNKGKSKCEPLLKEYTSKYRKIKFKLPDSEWWTVERREKLSEDYVFEAWKYDEKEGKGLTILVREYRWDTNYINTETNESIGGDNIGGLAKRSDREIQEYFKDIKERVPLRKTRLKRIPKVEMYSVKGRTEKGSLWEWKSFFFKHSKVQKTYRITVIATLGMEDHNPYELRAIMDEISLSKK